MDLDSASPEQIKQLISLLQGLLPKEDTVVIPNKGKKKPRKAKVGISEDDRPNNNIKTKTRTLKQANSYNKFLEMPEMSMHKSDTEIDKKLCKHLPTQRNREYKPIKVVCRVCGKTDSINPAILPDSADRYKCNKCSSSNG